MVIGVYEPGKVRVRIEQILLNLLILLFFILLGLLTVELVLKCLIICSPF